MSLGSDGYGLSGFSTLAPKMARLLVITIFGLITVTACVRVLAVNASLYTHAVSMACLVALLVLQLLWLSPRGGELPAKVRYALLFVQACLVYLPLLQFKEKWQGQPGFLFGSALIVLPPLLGWLGAGLVAASMGFAQAALPGAAIEIVWLVVTTMLTGFLAPGLTWFATLVTKLQSAREELAEMAVARERLRFTRDLHDLLGYNLSAITLKTELTHRLIADNPHRAREELTEILQISRQALADMRAVPRGYREMSLTEMCESARSVLAGANIHVQLDITNHELPVRTSTALATILREGITNLLHHSEAKNCHITVRQTTNTATIEILNDGVPDTPTDTRNNNGQGGNGIQNLSTRVTELGGHLTAQHLPNNTFQLHASIPSPTGAHGQASMNSSTDSARPTTRTSPSQP